VERHEAERSRWPKRLNVNAPVLICVDGAENEILCSGHFLQSLRFAAVDEAVRTQRAGFLFLALRGGEGRDLRAKGARELNGQVTRPPMPMTPTRDEGLTPCVRSGL